MFNKISSAERNYLHIKFPLKNYFDKSKPVRQRKDWGVGFGSELRLGLFGDAPGQEFSSQRPWVMPPEPREGSEENM